MTLRLIGLGPELSERLLSTCGAQAIDRVARFWGLFEHAFRVGNEDGLSLAVLDRLMMRRLGATGVPINLAAEVVSACARSAGIERAPETIVRNHRDPAGKRGRRRKCAECGRPFTPKAPSPRGGRPRTRCDSCR